MKFNKKSLMKLAILSSILGLSGMFLGDVTRGAEAADIGATVKVEFRHTDMNNENSASSNNEAQCVICLDGISHNDRNVVILDCGHYYHGGCLGSWKKSCPICRQTTEKVKHVDLSVCEECGKWADVPTSCGKALCLECAKKSVNNGNKYGLNKNDARNINSLLPKSEKIDTNKFNKLPEKKEKTSNSSEDQSKKITKYDDSVTLEELEECEKIAMRDTYDETNWNGRDIYGVGKDLYKIQNAIQNLKFAKPSHNKVFDSSVTKEELEECERIAMRDTYDETNRNGRDIYGVGKDLYKIQNAIKNA